MDVHVDQNLGYILDIGQRRITFTAGEHIYALKFPNDDQYK